VPATPTYGLPYPSLSDPPNGPAQIQALADEVEVELTRIDARVASGETLLAGFAPVTQSGSGTLVVGGNGLVVASLAISDPGFAYHIISIGSIGWTIPLATQPGNLIESSITLDSTVYTTNRVSGGFSVSHSIGAGFTQPTLYAPMKRTDAFGSLTGAHTIRLMARNTGATNMTIPAAGTDTAFMVRIVRA
jgi:hypothetical protein